VTIFSDSTSAIAVSKGTEPHQTTKYMDVKLFSIREHIEEGHVIVEYVKTDENWADIFTKSLSGDSFSQKADYLGFTSVPLPKSEANASTSQYLDAEENFE